MTTEIPMGRTIAALGEVWTSIGAVLASLHPTQWSAPSPLPGWDVRDNVSHIIGTEKMLLGEPNPEPVGADDFDHVRNDIARFNEAWVESMRGMDTDDVLAAFVDVTSRRRAALEEMTQEAWDAESFTPAGQATYGRFMQIRVFDCWLHEQDIRDAVGRPGHESGLAVEVTLDEMLTAMGFVVGKRAGFTTGQAASFVLTDQDAVVRRIDVEVGDRAGVVDELSGPATCTLTMPVGVMTRLCAGRIRSDVVRDQVSIDGDIGAGEHLLANLSYTI